ncbi:MAG TPA: type 1 glutamine amidotransferase [Ktedonobacteraceae bacterium]|nr:type 1 glutamine amidotransferase [Ktedonobacteraceae bacterium]
MKRVLALQHCWDDPPGYLGEILQEHDIYCETVKVEEAPVPEDAARYDAIISMGGPQHAAADEEYPYFIPEKALIRQALEQDIPFLGVCLGGQLLAHALGAPVRRHTMIELGFFEVQFTREGESDPLFRGLPGFQLVFHWHMDVFDIPKGGLRLASSENTLNQAFRIGPRAYGLQYHIELTPGMFNTWFQYPDYRQEIINVLGPDAPDLLEQQRVRHYPTYRGHTRIMFENFLRIAELIPAASSR